MYQCMNYMLTQRLLLLVGPLVFSLSLSPAHTLIHIQTRALSLSLTHTQTEITDKKLIHLVLLSALDIASHYFMNIVQNFPVMSMPFY